MKQHLQISTFLTGILALSLGLGFSSCKKNFTLDPTPVGIEIEYLGSNWDLSLCNDFHEGLTNAELEISVDRYTGDINNPLENFKTYFHDINNDTDDADNRIFTGVEVPTAGPFVISIVIKQECSGCCDGQTSGPGCTGQKGKPRFKGTSSTFDSGAGNPPPAKLLIEEKFIQCSGCGC